MITFSPSIVRDGLVFSIDTGNNNSLPAKTLPVKNGLVLWLDASDTNTISTSASVVTQWRDKGPYNYPVVLNGSPILSTAVQNNLNVISCSTTDGFYCAQNFPAPCTVIYGSRWTGGSNQRVLQGRTNNWLLGYHFTIDDAYFEGWVFDSAISADVLPRIHTGTIAGAGLNSSFYSSGSLKASNTNGVTGPNGLGVNGGGAVAELSNCALFEIIVYNRVLTEIELKKVHTYLNIKWGILCVDSSIFDISNNSYTTGSLVSASFSPPYSTLNGGTLNFDGNSHRIDINNVASIPSSFNSNATVDFWWKPCSSTSAMPMGWNSYDLVLQGSDFGFNSFNGDVWGVSNKLTLNSWNHVTAVFNYTNVTGSSLFINGNAMTPTQLASTPTNVNATFNNGNLRICGVRGDLIYKFSGSMGEFRIYNRNLTKQEALQNYMATKARYGH